MAEENKKNISNDELIGFCQLLSAVVKSNLPLANALIKYKDSNAKNRVSKLALDLAEKLKNGYTVEEAVSSLSEIDPVLTRLIPIVGDGRLVEIFDIYTKYLIRREMCRKQIKFLVGYPFFIMLTCLAVILFLNFKTFPDVMQLIEKPGFYECISLHLLYFAKIRFWPLSLVIPAFLVFMLFDSFYMLFTGNFIRYSLWGKITGLSKAIKTSEKARLAAMLSLYLKAGYTFERAVEEVSTFSEPVSKAELNRIQSRIASGNYVGDAISASELLSEILNGHENFNEMPEKLEYMYNGFNAEAILMLNSVSNKLFYISLILAGFMVFIAGGGFFGIYPAFIGGLI